MERRNSLTSKLTAGEKRVLTLLSFAKTNKEIACALGISPATVKRHLENVLRKLELRNHVEAPICGLIAGGCPCPLAAWSANCGMFMLGTAEPTANNTGMSAVTCAVTLANM